MKKLTVLFAIGLLSLSTFTQAGVPDYVITKDGITYYAKIHQGWNNSIVCADAEGKVTYEPGQIKAYRKDGRIYEKMPVVRNNKPTGEEEFMELLAYRNGLKMFRRTVAQTRANRQGEELLVYRECDFVVSLTQDNSETLKEFFFRPGHMLSNK